MGRLLTIICSTLLLVLLAIESHARVGATPDASAEDSHLIAAYAAVHSPRPEEAALHMGKVAANELSPELMDLWHWTNAQIARRDKRFSESLAFLEPLTRSQENPFFLQARLDKYGLLKEMDDWQAAKKELDALKVALPHLFSKAEWEAQAALIHLELHHYTNALKTAKALFIQSPEFSDDAWVAQALERIAVTKQTSLARLLTLAEWKLRLANALDKGAIAQARQAFDLLKTQHAKALPSAYLALTEAEIAFKERNYLLSRELFAHYLRAFPHAIDRAAVLGKLATSDARSGNTDRAIATNREIVSRYPKSSAAHWARYKIAFLEMDRKNWQEGETGFKALIQSRFKPTFRQSLWYAGWCAYQERRYAAARTHWKSLAASFPRDGWRSLYWQAKSFDQEGQSEKALSLYKDLAERARLDFYGFLALFKSDGKVPHWDRLPKRAGRAPWWETVPQGIHEQTIAAHGHSLLARQVARYIELGIDEAIPYGLKLLEASLGKSPNDLQCYLYLALRGGRYTSLPGLVSQHKNACQQIMPEIDWMAKYPRAWQRFVALNATRFQVPESLIYAIMRQESGFQAEVRSPANAIGLMQLIPSTAEQVARDLGQADFELADLKDPKTNIAMGSYYLHRLLRHEFHGVLPFAIAAYNAGPEAVLRWIATAPFSTDHWEEFVESIPYTETHQYVKKVMVNMWMYEGLYKKRHAGSPPL